jgi:1D-myo-inositol 3-kinase
MGKARILSVGHVTHDVYPEGIVPGGSAFYSAKALHALGAEACLATTVGMDFQCNDTIKEFHWEKSESGTTTRFRNIYPPNQPRVQRLDAWAPPVLPLSEPTDMDWIHLAPTLGEVPLEEWAVVNPAIRKTLAIQGWIKGPGPLFPEMYPDPAEAGPDGARGVVQIEWKPRAELLRHFSACFCGTEDLGEQSGLLDRLIRNIPIVACTFGGNGAEVYIEGKGSHVGVYRAKDMDPTGAGDSFAAGFLYGLSQGRDPLDAARLGAATASIVVEAVGASSMERIRIEVEARAKKIETF